jgi:hypothetical protein
VHTNQLKAAFDGLGRSDDLVSIKAALHRICSDFGIVTRMDVLLARQGDKRQALCFLRMENPEHERQIMRLLDIARFGGELVVVVDLPSQNQAQVNTPEPQGSMAAAAS